MSEYGDYPIGAGSDIGAPFNQKEEEEAPDCCGKEMTYNGHKERYECGCGNHYYTEESF